MTAIEHPPGPQAARQADRPWPGAKSGTVCGTVHGASSPANRANGVICANGADCATSGTRRPASTNGSHDAADGPANNRLNRLRAGVLGANDGIVSTAALVLGVAGATRSHTAILVAGMVGLLSGAMSMAAGEYVSVSARRDSERAVLIRQAAALDEAPNRELDELAGTYRAKGIDPDLAHRVALQLTAHDPLAAHAEARHGIDPGDLTNPLGAAAASFIAFVVGALIPMLGVLSDASSLVTAGLVVVALALTGAVGAHLGRSAVVRAVLRNVGGGLAAMIVTYGLGTAVGVVV